MAREQDRTKMAAIEKMMVQIFERKKRIVEQVKQQTLLFDQHLASKCILDGIAPPPWLWSPSFPSQSSAPNAELGKEELISGLLHPYTQPTIPYSNKYCSLYNQPVAAPNRRDLDDSFIKEACISTEGFNAGDRLSISLLAPVSDTGAASNGTQKPNSEAVTSSSKQREAWMSDAELLAVSAQFPITDVRGTSVGVQKPDSKNASTSPRNQRDAGMMNTEDQLYVSPKRPINDTEAHSNSTQKRNSEFATSFNNEKESRMSDAGDLLAASPKLPVTDVRGTSVGVQKPDSNAVMSPRKQRDEGMMKSGDQLFVSSQTDTRMSDAGDHLFVSKLTIGDGGVPFNGVQKPDYSAATSLPYQRDLRMSGAGDLSSVSPELPVSDVRDVTSDFQKRGSGASTSPQHQRDATPSGAVDLLSSVPPDTGFQEQTDTGMSDAGDQLFVSKLTIGDDGVPSSGVQKPDYSVDTSLPYQRDLRMSGAGDLSSPELPVSDVRDLTSDFQKAGSGAATPPQHQTDATPSGAVDLSSSVPSDTGFQEQTDTRMSDPGDQLFVSKLTTGDDGVPSSGVQKPNYSAATSLPYQRDLRMSGAGDLSSVSPELPVSDVRDVTSYFQKPGSGAATSPRHQRDATPSAAVDLSSSVPPELSVCNVGGSSIGVQKPDCYAVSSPQDQKYVGMSEVSPDPARSSLIVQRSKSRQRALNIRNSAKSSESHPGVESNASVVATRFTGSQLAGHPYNDMQKSELVETFGTKNRRLQEEAKAGDLNSQENGLQLDGALSNKPAVTSHSEELHGGLYTEVQSAGKDFAPGDAPSEMHQLPQVDSGSTSPNYQIHETPLNVDPEPLQSLAKIQRSKSRQRALELRDSAKPAKSSSCVDNDICVYSSVLFESGIWSSNSGVVHESELGLPSQLKDGQDRDQLSDCVSASPSSGEDNVVKSDVCRSLSERICHVKAAGIFNDIPIVEKAKASDSQSKEKSGNIYSGRITRSRSSSQQASSQGEPLIVGNLSSTRRSSSDGSHFSSKSKKLTGKKSTQTDKVLGSEDGSLTHKRQKVELSSLKKMDRSIATHCSFVPEESETPLVSSVANQASPQDCIDLVEAGVADPSSTILDSGKQCTVGENEVLLHLNATFTDSGKQGRAQIQENDDLPSSSVRQSTDFLSAGQIMPEFEGFIVKTDDEQTCIGREGMNLDKLELPKTTIERASLLERICKSACMHKPSEFSITYDLVPTLHQSVPDRLLECMDLKRNLNIDDNIETELDANGCCSNEEVNHGGSYTDELPFSSPKSIWDIRKPLMSPFGKFWNGVMSNSGSSEKRGSLNSELPCINEEHENIDEMAVAFKDSTGSEIMPSSVERRPLADITESVDLLESVAEAGVLDARNSLESINTEYSFSETCNKVNKKLGQHNITKKRHTRTAKESCIRSTRSSTKRISKSVNSTLGKPKLSVKDSLRKGGPSLLDREYKRGNIVSNVTSFVPLVQRKQAAAAITGKRDVKVKALEAAEAAKRHAEEKAKERKMKKEALKVERARIEQENLKQVELEKKKKEEERKKKEADMAARKRQREEEEKKEKERKRMRIVESRKQQRENQEKLRVKKEKGVKCQATDERVNETNLLNNKLDKQNEKEKEMKDEGLQKMLKSQPKANVVSTNETGKGNLLNVCEDSTHFGGSLKVISNLAEAAENDSRNQEQSYDISPYKGSDDEDEDEDEMPNSKFIPSWASKKCLAMVISSQQRLNPEVIFPPESFCSIAEVLLPRKLQPK